MTTYGPSYTEVTSFPELVGQTFARIDGKEGADSMDFLLPDGTGWRFFHSQDCCESVAVNDIVGTLDDLIGSPMLFAEEVSSEGAPAPEHPDSYTWTFYRFGTAKGTVTVRWLGESNGYYSESVSFAPVGGKS